MARMELLVVAAVAMGAGLALADGAISRGGGSAGGSSSAGSSGGGVSSSSSSGGSSSSGSSHSASSGSHSGAIGRSPATPAQARQPRPGPGHHGNPGSSYQDYSYGGAGYYGYYPYNAWIPGYGWYGNPWYASIGWGYGGSGYYGAGAGYWGFYDPFFFGYYAPIRAGGGGGRARASALPATIRLVSEPEDAAVIVDERQVGVASDFDDMSERLRLSPGSHEIIIRKPGYVSHRMQVYVQAGEDLKVRHFLDKGTGETTETIGAPPPKLDLRTTVPPSEGAEVSRERQDAELESAEPATLTVQVDPEDASVYVDGRFQGTSDDVSDLELPAGAHTIEVVRPGYRSAELKVTLVRGKDKSMEVRLEKP